MKRAAIRSAIALVLALAAFGARAGSAAAAAEPDRYGLQTVTASRSTTEAGAHPDFTIDIAVKTNESGAPFAATKDVDIEIPPGLFGNPAAFPMCTADQLASSSTLFAVGEESCPRESQVGTTEIALRNQSGGIIRFQEPVFNMVPPGGDVVARLAFIAEFFPVYINVRVDPDNHYALTSSVESIGTLITLLSAETTLWGVPAAPQHDPQRLSPYEASLCSSLGSQECTPHSSSQAPVPFMTNPTSCGEAMAVKVSATSYQRPDVSSTLSAPMAPTTGCGLASFEPSTTLKPTTSQGTTGSGLDYELDLPSKGLQFPNLSFGSELNRAEVKLPEGMTINPSEAEGLGVCSEEDLSRETYDSPPNAGCPETSKVGSVEAISPVIDKKATGSLFLAKPYANPFGSLVALYMVVKIPDRGVLVKLPGEVTTDPQTGQITTVFEDVPQLPVSEFKLHFREGARAPLITPASCGNYEALSNLSPWAAPSKITALFNSFKVESGPSHGPCPNGGIPPFRPGLVAGTLNNAAGAFSPFDVRLTRTDAEQEMTHFSIKLPPGVVGKLAGIPFCPDSAIAAAKARTGIHGGEEEIDAPSCPAASQIGTSLAGSGVGDVLVYVPGKVYLAGPYHGSPLSIVAITAAKAGPFDLGTVVIREALSVNPETGEVFVDATGSDPIPHIIQGIPVHLRDIRVYVDRPNFTLNPSDCTRTSTASTVLGSGLDFASEADDRPITVTSPFQAADCAALPFKPKLSLKLLGGTKRGQFPRLQAFLRMNGIGEAGIARAQVTLPASEFIANAHFNTICTRVQFSQLGGNGEACPAGSVYGWARAKTPILAEPLEGPIFLRSSEHQLPDVVASLRGQEINVHLVGHVDSVKGKLRNTFEAVPDAPVEWASFSFQGGKKGLFENSTNLCQGAHRAIVAFTGQNGKEHDFNPAIKARCSGDKRRKR